MSAVTILSIKSADRSIAMSRYDSPIYWDISLPTLHRVIDAKLVKAFDESIDPKTVVSFVAEHCSHVDCQPKSKNTSFYSK